MENKEYISEVKEKWGSTSAFKEYENKTKNYSKEKWNTVNQGLENIMGEFSICLKSGELPDSNKTQNLVKELKSFICDNYYECTDEILLGLGQMYVADERFRENIDKNLNGTAEYISEAIKIYCYTKFGAKNTL